MLNDVLSLRVVWGFAWEKAASRRDDGGGLCKQSETVFQFPALSAPCSRRDESGASSICERERRRGRMEECEEEQSSEGE